MFDLQASSSCWVTLKESQENTEIMNRHKHTKGFGCYTQRQYWWSANILTTHQQLLKLVTVIEKR